MSRRVFTIGAYGFDAEGFFGALSRAGVDVFVDVRQRRGLRGSRYAFANAGRLTEELAARQIAYRHLKELAPDSTIRDLQRSADAAAGATKSSRSALAPEFVREYTSAKLDRFDWQRLTTELEEFVAPAFFCVERLPESCHRGLVAAKVADLLDLEVVNLHP